MDDAVQAAVDEGCATPRVNDTGAVQLQPDLAPAVAVEPAHSPRIGTKGLFPIMDLPSELRLEILYYLLVLPEPVYIETLDNSYFLPGARPCHPRPSTAILRTCKDINAEGTPILYAKNRFIVCLSTSLNAFVGINPGPGCSLANSLFLQGIRWSTIALIRCIGFSSSSMMTPSHDPVLPLPPRSNSSFICTGEDIIDRFAESDFIYCPWGPDRFMTLSISNWVSMQVMRAELTACQEALESLMRFPPSNGAI